jgi:diketogulonate reductase-like aldo/keto reductase
MGMTDAPRLPLNTGSAIPQLGFGVFQVPPADTTEAVLHALECGYRSIDTAAAYGNERGVGEAVRASGLPREDVFITTKVWNSDQGAERTRRAFERSLRELDLDYVDLYLVHWPAPSRDLYVETWRTLEEIHSDGRAKAIGVSNFLAEHLQRVLDECDVVPAVNQIELHPRLQQPDLRAFHARNDIVTEAWSPLAKGGELLDDPAIAGIATAHDRTPAQVVLRWHVQLGNVAIPKSVTPERIAENINVFDFQLSDDEMARIARLDAGERTGPDPRTFSG